MDRESKDEVRARIVADALASGVDLDLRVITEPDECPSESVRAWVLDSLQNLDLVAFWINGRLDSVRSVGKDQDPEGLCTSAADLAADLMSEELAAKGASNWPRCPEHPSSHPLQPDIGQRGRAVWACPRGTYEVPIGRLAAHPRSPERD